ncbi:hypothetical protein [Rhizobium grahamii]|nr:hypothetical protein [Rhizobium grahamii]
MPIEKSPADADQAGQVVTEKKEGVRFSLPRAKPATKGFVPVACRTN